MELHPMRTARSLGDRTQQCRSLPARASSDVPTVQGSRTVRRKPKQIDLKHLKEQLSEQAKVNVPFHSLHPEEGPPQSLLEKADQNLNEYCSALPGDERSERCWQAVRYFEEQKAAAEAGCLLPSGEREHGSEACGSLEHLEGFVRQFVGQAPTHMFVQTLLVLEAADRHARERGADSGASGEEEQASEAQLRRQRLADLFYAMDADLNGMLDVGEFREAMRQADKELPGVVVSKVLESMDVHGRLTLDQFLAIVDAEEIYANTPLAAWLRRAGAPELSEPQWGEL